MPAAARHPDNAARIAALCAYDLLDTPRDPEFDEITRLVSMLCDAPISVINLIDRDRQWFLSEVGLGVRSTPLESSICAHAILQNDFFEVPDLSRDERFADNPLVTEEPRLRYYAGTLLKDPDGYPIGTLCVLDYQPRTLSEAQRDALEVLGRRVIAEFELRRQGLEQARLTARLQAALEERQAILNLVSHDLRTPLSVVRLGAKLVPQMADLAARQAMAGRLHRAERQMARLVDDLLDASSVKDGRLSVLPQLVDVSRLLTESAEVLRPQAQTDGLDYQLDIAPDLGQAFWDPDRIAQLVQNLLSNAVKFTPSGGRVSATAAGDDDHITVAVTDTGPGIPADLQATIFDAFVQAKGDRRGVGLGLAIVRGIVERHRGIIELESAPGVGSVFRLTLPRHALSPAAGFAQDD